MHGLAPLFRLNGRYNYDSLGTLPDDDSRENGRPADRYLGKLVSRP
jgi:hypothetical protein